MPSPTQSNQIQAQAGEQTKIPERPILQGIAYLHGNEWRIMPIRPGNSEVYHERRKRPGTIVFTVPGSKCQHDWSEGIGGDMTCTRCGEQTHCSRHYAAPIIKQEDDREWVDRARSILLTYSMEPTELPDPTCSCCGESGLLIRDGDEWGDGDMCHPCWMKFGTEARDLLMDMANQPTQNVLAEALVEHNEALRSASSVCARRGKDTNWDAFAGMVERALINGHAASNKARAALSNAPPPPDSNPPAKSEDHIADAGKMVEPTKPTESVQPSQPQSVQSEGKVRWFRPKNRYDSAVWRMESEHIGKFSNAHIRETAATCTITTLLADKDIEEFFPTQPKDSKEMGPEWLPKGMYRFDSGNTCAVLYHADVLERDALWRSALQSANERAEKAEKELSAIRNGATT